MDVYTYIHIEECESSNLNPLSFLIPRNDYSVAFKAAIIFDSSRYRGLNLLKMCRDVDNYRSIHYGDADGSVPRLT